MDALLSRYLVHNRQVLLPGLGTLQVWPNPARYDAGQQKIIPSRLSFQWAPADEASGSVQPLVGFISQQSGLTEEECFDELFGFCGGIKQSLDHNGEWRWPGLGKLVKLAGGKTGFVPDAMLDAYTAPIDAIRIAHSGRTHQMVVGDKETDTSAMQQLLNEEAEEEPVEGKWWIASVIIGSAALLLILARLIKVI
ncbi:MAG TPA: hypothetical protein VK907_05130 [Phnomibacter sp.]|nr:hypothetical protein [Phnomibacter sp.]